MHPMIPPPVGSCHYQYQCYLMAISFEGGEPIMTMLRRSELPVMLAVEVFVRIDLR